ncbi:hypothetical protein D3C81_2055900 [compost metagenome]
MKLLVHAAPRCARARLVQDSPSAPVRACPWTGHPSGKPVKDTPLYFTPGVVPPDDKRHDRFEGVQQQAAAAVPAVMA